MPRKDRGRHVPIPTEEELDEYEDRRDAMTRGNMQDSWQEQRIRDREISERTRDVFRPSLTEDE